jgi:hypothetical protein
MFSHIQQVTLVMYVQRRQCKGKPTPLNGKTSTTFCTCASEKKRLLPCTLRTCGASCTFTHTLGTLTLCRISLCCQETLTKAFPRKKIVLVDKFWCELTSFCNLNDVLTCQWFCSVTFSFPPSYFGFS